MERVNQLPIVHTVSLAMSVGDETGIAANQAFYYRKAYKPALFMRIIQMVLISCGFLNYSKLFIDCLAPNSRLKLKILTALGTCLFVISYFLSVLVIGPLEKKIGETFGKTLPDPQDLRWLLNWHFLSIGLAGFMGSLNVQAYQVYDTDRHLYLQSKEKQS